MNDARSRLEVIRKESQLVALENEWSALWRRAHGRHYQRFEICLLAWLEVAKPQGRRLHCIVIREHGELRLVLPMVSYRRALWTYLIPLSPDAADYTSALVEDGPQTMTLVEQAWRAARECCRADFVHAIFVKEGTELQRLMMNTPRILGMSRHEWSSARLRDEPHDWGGFCASLGTLHGKKPGQLERRLAKEGALRVRMLDASDRADIARCIRAMLTWKRRWSERVGKRGAWLHSPHYERFLIAMLTHREDSALARLFAVTLDDEPIAVAVMSHGEPVANAVISSFDPDYGRFGAGTVAWEHAVKWAFERRFDIDFGVGSERFKKYWSRDAGGHAWTVQIANSTWGLVSYRIVRAGRELLDRLRGVTRETPEINGKRGR
jgi:CelD/BcsL family acetyltransferase involved in cellulose biosynthesis